MSAPAVSPFAEPPAPHDTGEVHRLHPFTLVLGIVGLLPQFIYIIPAMYFGLNNGGGLAFIGPALLAVLALSLGFSWLKWHRFTYRIGAEELRITSGIFNRNARSIPFERIQDVNVEQKLLARIFGLATVKLETGSAGGDDGVLNAVSLAEAARLRDIVRQRKSDVPQVAAQRSDSDITADAPEQHSDAAPIFAMDGTRIFIAGIFNFSLVIFAVLAAAAQNLDFLIPDAMFDPSYWIDRIDASGRIQTLSLWSRIGGFLVAIFSLVVVGLASGIIRSFLREYGFRLDRTQNGFRRRRGLTTLTDVVMPLHRIQAASILTGPVRRRFGWYHLKFQSLASDGKHESDHSVAPLARLDEIDRIMAEPEIARDPGDAPYIGVETAYWHIPAILAAAVSVFAATLAALIVDTWALALVIVAVPLAAIFYLRWTHHRYVLSDSQLFVRHGFWRQKLTILPVRKVQSVDLRQSLLARMFGHANVVIGVAGGSGMLPLTIHALPDESAQELRGRLLKPVS